MAEERSGLEATLDELLKGKKTKEIVGPNGLLKQLTKALLERAMNAELTYYLAMRRGRRRAAVAATTETATAGRECRVISVRSRSRCRAIATGASSRRF